MQRLSDTDVFLAPDGEGARICRLGDHGVTRGARVSLRVDAPMRRSREGRLAAVVRKGRKGQRLWLARSTDGNRVRQVIRCHRFPRFGGETQTIDYPFLLR